MCCAALQYIKGSDDHQPGGDCFFFDYGVVACWGLTKAQEMTLVGWRLGSLVVAWG